jgi:hypothetical protein
LQPRSGLPEVKCEIRGAVTPDVTSVANEH